MKVTLLPGMTAAMAKSITGGPTASRMLDGFEQHHSFTGNHVRNRPSYQPHPLFRALQLAQV
ncbi:MAG: hypothetical protein OEZ10_11380 [Gammaproteobacteria bacterium]|nr:hypothetical protein [Gammaproteobacteria bacterium]